jgi:hypothetical protein
MNELVMELPALALPIDVDIKMVLGNFCSFCHGSFERWRIAQYIHISAWLLVVRWVEHYRASRIA